MKFKLRKFKRGDEISLIKNINDKEITSNTSSIPYPYKKKDAFSWININLKLHKLKKPPAMNFAIDINGEVAGGIGLIEIDRKHNNAEIGYWLAKKYWNKGIMTNAIKKVLILGFNELELKRIYAYVYPFNKGSKRVLEKTGFLFEGRLKKN